MAAAASWARASRIATVSQWVKRVSAPIVVERDAEQAARDQVRHLLLDDRGVGGAGPADEDDGDARAISAAATVSRKCSGGRRSTRGRVGDELLGALGEARPRAPRSSGRRRAPSNGSDVVIVPPSCRSRRRRRRARQCRRSQDQVADERAAQQGEQHQRARHRRRPGSVRLAGGADRVRRRRGRRGRAPSRRRPKRRRRRAGRVEGRVRGASSAGRRVERPRRAGPSATRAPRPISTDARWWALATARMSSMLGAPGIGLSIGGSELIRSASPGHRVGGEARSRSADPSSRAGRTGRPTPRTGRRRRCGCPRWRGASLRLPTSDPEDAAEQRAARPAPGGSPSASIVTGSPSTVAPATVVPPVSFVSRRPTSPTRSVTIESIVRTPSMLKPVVLAARASP